MSSDIWIVSVICKEGGKVHKLCKRVSQIGIQYGTLGMIRYRVYCVVMLVSYDLFIIIMIILLNLAWIMRV